MRRIEERRDIVIVYGILAVFMAAVMGWAVGNYVQCDANGGVCPNSAKGRALRAQPPITYTIAHHSTDTPCHSKERDCNS